MQYINSDYPSSVQNRWLDIDNASAPSSGVVVSESPISHVVKTDLQRHVFYVKYYREAGKGLKKFVGRSRLQSEWENLEFCRMLNIPVPKVVAYVEPVRSIRFKPQAGILVTEEVPHAVDLKYLADHSHPILQNAVQRRRLMTMVADYLRRLHQRKFVHYDIRWRNILVTVEVTPEVYFFDMPNGRVRKFSLRHGIKRDFYCLYRDASRFLSHTDCLRFYLNYLQIKRLSKHHKKQLRDILAYCFKKM